MLDDPLFYSGIGDFVEGPQVEAIIDGKYIYIYDTDPALEKLLSQQQLPPIFPGQKNPTLMSLDA